MSAIPGIISKLKASFKEALDNFEEQIDSDDLKIVAKIYNSITSNGNAWSKHKLINDLQKMTETFSCFDPVGFLITSASKLRTVITTEFKNAIEDVELDEGGAVIFVKEFIATFKKFPALLLAIKNKFSGNEKALGNVPAKKAEAPKTAPLGQIAFAPARARVPFEPNTKVEQDLYDSLLDHFHGEHFLNSKQAELMRKILSKGLYASVIHEPTTEVVYRGMVVPKAWLAKALKIKPGKLSKKGSISKSFTFTPRKGESSSWTTSKRSAENFANQAQRGEVAIVLYAEVERNPNRFVAGPGGLYKVKGPDYYSNEKEAVGLGNIKVSKVTWTDWS